MCSQIRQTAKGDFSEGWHLSNLEQQDEDARQIEKEKERASQSNSRVNTFKCREGSKLEDLCREESVVWKGWIEGVYKGMAGM